VNREELSVKAGELLGEGIEKNALPAFSRTADKLNAINDADEKGLSELSAIILSDPGMTTRVLRASNSAYRVRRGKSNSVSRAVVMLGVDEVKRICLGSALVEGLMANGASDFLVSEMAKAFHAATQARMIAVQKGERNSEEVFIAALLKSLGPLMYWGGRGEESDDFLEQLQPKDRPPEDAERELLGVELTDLSEHIADKWKLSLLLPTEEDEDPKRRERAKRVALCTKLARRSHLGLESEFMSETRAALAEESGLTDEALDKVVSIGAQEAASAAYFFGAPEVAEALIKVSAKLSGRDEASVLAEARAKEEELNEVKEPEDSSSNKEEEPVVAKVDTLEEVKQSEGSSDSDDGRWAGGDEQPDSTEQQIQEDVPQYEPNIQLETLREISNLMLLQSDPSVILGKILYGMHQGIGLDRVLFAIVDRGASVLSGRIALGAAGPSWHERCRFVIEEGSYLWRLGEDPIPRWVKGDELKEIPHHMQVVFGRGEFLLAPVFANGNWVAVFYGDRRKSRRDLNDEVLAAFGQFALQGAFALSKK
jgi:HD-like signal output (HDOD) protein